MPLNATHDPTLRSWIPSAQAEGTPFPIQNLPFGVFRTGRGTQGRVGIAIGDRILDVGAAHALGLVRGVGADACLGSTLNPLLALGSEAWSELRAQVSRLLSEDAPPADREAARTCLVAMDDARMLRPIDVGDYTDFYASRHHAENVGRMFRPDDEPLLPNYLWIPIGYHGRASSVVVDGTPVKRPAGQKAPPAPGAPPRFGPTERLDWEMEIGAVVGPANELGTPVPIGDAWARIFGFCLLNDWSARDLQAWEYRPLGPFLGKSFATTMSPWIVTAEALEPFRVPAPEREPGEPRPLPYLTHPDDVARGGLDLRVEVHLRTSAMRARGEAPARVSHGTLRDMTWTFAQMLTHHTSNGCNLRPGDLLGSGTISGTDPASFGSILELARGGKEPLTIGGESRAFLEDGDEVVMTGYCEAEGFVPIGFGSCRGVVEPSR